MRHVGYCYRCGRPVDSEDQVKTAYRVYHYKCYVRHREQMPKKEGPEDERSK